ncbi:MAG TPA: hypothetical protein VJV79_27305 [Polyangiaceae bacterium]|nr:hypothetical protein [Polyangiaceae bacterium]
MPYDEQDLEQLLAQGHLSGRAYDEIESRVMQRVVPRARVARLYWVLAAALPAAAAVGGLLFYLGVPSRESNAGGGFTAKGIDSSFAGAVELRCSSERACRVGDTLLFLVDTGVAHGYLNASAQRISPPSPERIRLFPTESGESPYLEATGGMTVVDKGIRLQKALGPGVYRIDVRWTDAAPSPDPSAGHGTSVELRIDE